MFDLCVIGRGKKFCTTVARSASLLLLASCLHTTLFAESPATDGPPTTVPAGLTTASPDDNQGATSSSDSSLPDAPSVSDRSSTSESSSRPTAPSTQALALTPSSPALAQTPDMKFNLKGALFQSFEVTFFFETWRTAFDPSLRYNLAHKPFYHDWFASYAGYNMQRWGDGDDFIVNDVGHPLEGAVFAQNFLINSPNSWVPIGKNRRYWMSRLKALGWAAVWSTQSEIGPLSETNFGNQGGITYVPGCGTDLSCLHNPKYPKPPTNNTGWTDFVITPTVGMLWVLGEDTIEKYIVSPVAENHRILGGRVLRSALEPSRSFAAIFSGRFPWELPFADNGFVMHRSRHPGQGDDAPKPPVNRWEIGTQYTAVTLPVMKTDCNCVSRQYNSGVGFNFNYNLMRGFGLDSTVNVLPGQGGSRGMVEGLFGFKWGERWEKMGLFAKVRPGFIYYQDAMPGGGVYTAQPLTRFAADLGGIVEYYPSRNSTMRFDVGTTLVRYLTNRTDPRMSELGSLISDQYIVTQGNFQLSTGYVYRF